MKNIIDLKKFEKHYKGKRIQLFTLKNNKGITTQITNYGGRIVNLFTPDRNGNIKDIVLGYDNIADYFNKKEVFFGAIIGRYGNRIAKGKFKIDNIEYNLETNSESSKNHLHGGNNGFHNVVWDAQQISDSELQLSYLSKDGEEGYPGNLKVKVIYQLTDSNELKIKYSATVDKKTIVNLTHHSYFNLTGNPSQTITEHFLQLNAKKFTPVDNNMIPNGKIKSVTDTPFDFTKSKAIGLHIKNKNNQLLISSGYDHNFVLDGNGLKKAASVYEPISGRTLEVLTTEPSIQFYSGNHLNNISGKYQDKYNTNSAFCLEPQHVPDSPNQSHFPSTELNLGELYTSKTIFRFGTKT